ncbi:MAG TPA: hypothetical protein VFT55_01410 [Planctomycetota bacterium]|nr:hypothetical protein [Planctomycetota bacterium]
MRVPRAVWAVVYYACTAGSLASVLAVSAQLVGDGLDSIDVDVVAGVSAAAGALLGFWLAWWKRNSRAAHLALRIVGCGLVLLGLACGVVTYLEAQRPRDTSGNMMAGLGIAIGIVVTLGVVGIGTAVWLAGFSGRRIAQQLTAAPTPSSSGARTYPPVRSPGRN